jgi:protein-tyrosine-phosphatase
MLRRKLQTLGLRWRARRALADAPASSLRALEGRRGNHVLVICHGNIYRSAFVGEYLRRFLGGDFQVQSAGFHPVGDRTAPARYVEMSATVGIDLRSHRSCVVSGGQLAWSDVIVLMDRRNWVQLVRAGADPSRFVWLGALAADPVEIDDPYEADDAKAHAILQRLVTCSEALVRRLLARNPASATG